MNTTKLILLPKKRQENTFQQFAELLKIQFASLPSYIQKSIRPQKQVPNYGKNVDWLHNKMKLKVTLPGGEAGYVNYKCAQFKGQSFIVQS